MLNIYQPTQMPILRTMRFWLALMSILTAFVLEPAAALAAGEIVITRQPINVSTTSGKTIQFSVGLSNSDTYTYQWYKDSTKVTNGTSRWLTLSNVTRSQAGKYRVRVSKGTLYTYSEFRLLTVDGATSSTTTTTTPTTTVSPTPTTTTTTSTSTNTTTSITVSRQPKPVTVAVGATFQMSVGADGEGKESFVYQWYKDGQKVTGGATRWLTIRNPTVNESGNYKVQVSNSKGSVYSNSAYAKVGTGVAVTAPIVDTTSKVIISLHPMDAAIFTGKSVTLNVSASSEYTVNYQWRKNGVAVTNGTLSHLTLSAATLADAGKYDVVVSDKYGSKTSTAANVSVTVDRKASFSWTAPATRTNGATLLSTEIKLYRIYHTSTDANVETMYEIDASLKNHELANLQNGVHNFAITAVDTNSFESDFSAIASKTIK